MAAILDNLRNGAFLTKERLWLVPSALLLGFVVAIGVLFASAHGLSDYAGRPLGTDFSNVYAAGVAVRHGDAAAPYDPVRQYAQEKSIFGPATPFYGWHYPPYFLLVAALLARLPYLAALIVWQITTLALYGTGLWTLLSACSKPQFASDPRWLLWALAFPALFVNITHGNNGFLTAALLAGALACLDRRPAVAGVLFGLLVYKPQFALMIPLALIAGGHWRTAIAGLLTIVALSVVVTLAFGLDVWSAFLVSTRFARTVVLEQGGTGFNKIQSVFAWVRMWGGSVGLAYFLQAAVSVATACALVAVWRQRVAFAYQGAVLCLAVLLATPYCLDYDLMALAPAIALLAARDRFEPYEKTALAALWLVPIVAREAAAAIFIPLGTLAMLGAAALLVRNALHPRAGELGANWPERGFQPPAPTC